MGTELIRSDGGGTRGLSDFQIAGFLIVRRGVALLFDNAASVFRIAWANFEHDSTYSGKNILRSVAEGAQRFNAMRFEQSLYDERLGLIGSIEHLDEFAFSLDRHSFVVRISGHLSSKGSR